MGRGNIVERRINEKWWCNRNKWKGGKENDEEERRGRSILFSEKISTSLYKISTISTRFEETQEQ